MTERGYVRLDTAVNALLVEEEAPLPANLRTAADIDTQIGTATQAALDLKANTSTVNTALALKANTADLGTAAALDIDTDDTLAANSDSLVPTQQAVKAYVDANVGGGGTGDVVGPASSTNNNFAQFDGTTGKLLEDSGVSASAFQAADSKLTDIAGLAVTDSNIIVGNGTTWVAESGATLRASIGVGTGDSPQFTGVNLGHASDTTITRVSSGLIAVEGSNVMMAGTENQALTGGATVTSKSLGTQSSGTLTLDLGDRPLQHYTNGGAHTLAPGTVTSSAIIDITNNASAGAITTSGWTKVAGDSFSTTNAHKFRCHCSVGNGGSLLIVQALQ